MSTMLTVVLLVLVLLSVDAQFTCPAPWLGENSTLVGSQFTLGIWRSLSIGISTDAQMINSTACIVDTGAEVTFISDRVAKHYPSKFMCHNKLMQGFYGVGAEMIDYMYICFASLYINRDVRTSAVVLVQAVADPVFTTKHKCILGFGTLEATQAEINFRCGYISFVKGNHSEETFREDVSIAMDGLGITMDSLIPYNLLNHNISENAEQMKKNHEGKYILFSSIAKLGSLSSGLQWSRR